MNMNIEKMKTRLAWRVEEVAKATGLSVPFLRKEIRDGKLNAKKMGRCVVILDQELRIYLMGDKYEKQQ